jgi:hypothetical protein
MAEFTLAAPKIRTIDRLGFYVIVAMPLAALTNVFSLAQIGSLHIRLTDILFSTAVLLLVFSVSLGTFPRNGFGTYAYKIVTLLSIAASCTLFLEYSVDWWRYLRLIETLLWGAFALMFIKTEAQCQTLMNSVVASMSVLSIASVYIYIEHPGLQRIAGYFSFADGRGLPVQASYNEIGALFALALAVLCWRTLWGGWSLSRYIMLALMMGGLVFDQSRSGFLAAAVVLGIFIALLIGRMVRDGPTLRSAIPLLYVVILLAGSIAGSRLLPVNRISETFISGSGSDMSVLARYDLWNRAVELWTADSSRFFLGYGSERFANLMGSSTADSFYLDHGVSEGFIGLSIILSILFAPVLRVIRQGIFERIATLALLILVVIMIVSITGNVLVDPMVGGVTFSLLYGLAAARSYESFVKAS